MEPPDDFGHDLFPDDYGTGSKPDPRGTDTRQEPLALGASSLIQNYGFPPCKKGAPRAQVSPHEASGKQTTWELNFKGL